VVGPIPGALIRQLIKSGLLARKARHDKQAVFAALERMHEQMRQDYMHVVQGPAE
jgi:hypothetical protein